MFTVLALFSTNTNAQKEILVSRDKENGHYIQFLLRTDSTLILRTAYGQPEDSIELWLQTAGGILITGGEDIHPAMHDKGDEVDKCGTFDLYRDTLEYRLITYGRDHGIPVLGICRGEQMLNVALGGSLFTDIPTDIGKKVKHRKRRKTATHEVTIEPSSLLHKITGVTSGTVNSSHHQCVDRPAETVNIAARAPDGVVEAIEYTGDGWSALGVQWHPERMDYENPLSGNIARWFVEVMDEETPEP